MTMRDDPYALKIWPQTECPRYERCSVNHCPLDPEQDQHLSHPLDKEQKCPMEKPVRFKIGQKYPDLLPMLGLTAREWAGKQAFDRLSLADKAALAQKGKESLERHRKTK